MRVILLFIVLFKSVFSYDYSEEKYIDLLPEEEKRQFLEKIARRILQDYQNNNQPNASHMELSDTELDAHSAYVQGLLQEETQNLRDNRKNKPQRDEQEKQENEEVEEGNRNSPESVKSFADLTLRSGKRSKRRNTNKEHNVQEYDVIPVSPIYDEIQTVNNKTSSSKSTNQQENTTTEKDEQNITENKTLYSDELNNDTSYSNALRNSFTYDDDNENDEQNYGVDDGLKSTVIDNFEPSTHESDNQSSKEKTVIEEITTNFSLDNTTTSVATLKQNIREGDLTRKGNKDSLKYNAEVETSDLVTSVSTEIKSTISNTKPKSSTVTPSTTQKDEILITSNDLTSVIDDDKNNISIGGLKLIDVDFHDYNFAKVSSNTQYTESITTKTTVNTDSVNITSTFLPSTTNEPTTVNLDEKNTIITNSDSYIEQITVNSNDIESNANSTGVHSDKEFKRENRYDMGIFEARKKNPIRKIVKSEETIIKGVKTIESIEIPVNESKSVYYVYEASAEKSPFRSHDNEEHPYYAPVYNYAPEFAFYNPYNRFGPNTDDTANKDSYEKTLTRAKSQFNKDKRRNRFKNHQSSNNNPYKWGNMINVLKHKQYNVMQPEPIVPNSANFNPNDYIDMDYFFGRSGDNELRRGKQKKYAKKTYFPDTNESDHPYNIQNSLQDHIRAVRKLMYAQKQFGYIPDRPKVSSKDKTKKLRSKDLTLSDVFRVSKSKEDITLDYYFDRQNSYEESSEHHELLKLKLARLKDIPNPIKDESIKKEKVGREKGKEDDIENIVNVLRDMIKMDNEELVNYDWLISAVDIQSALNKLNNLTKLLKSNAHLHPDDFELLKYVIYLYKSTKTTNEATISIASFKNTLNELRKRIKKKNLMPKIQKKKKKFASAIKMWKDFRTFLRSLMKIQNDKKEMLRQFESFIAEVEFNLNNFHDAIKNIASITTYNNQRWFTDLKDVYLKHADKRELLEVILHLSLSRLLGLIEESSKNGLEEDFSNFVKKNREEVNYAKEELEFILRLLNKFKSLN